MKKNLPFLCSTRRSISPLHHFISWCFLVIIALLSANAQTDDFDKSITTTKVAKGWANNSVNAVVFRKNALVTHQKHQYIAYYDENQHVVLGKRQIGDAEWTLRQTQYTGNAKDAHNSISIMVDGDGYLHMAWDHHNNALRYARSSQPGSLQLTEKMSMTGKKEDEVTYPEFYKLPGGDLLFFYRSGASGKGDLVINRYDVDTKSWKQMQSNLIDGEGERNAYWQACVDKNGTIHISWVWRETWDVATNHDICYAQSKDGGKTWANSGGEKYDLPITIESAEVAWSIGQNSELINQTSMTADSNGHPVIATYWKDDGAKPYFHVVYFNGMKWQAEVVYKRQTDFSLSGGGTKRIPISRPQVLMGQKDGQDVAIMIFRDTERGNKASVAINYHFPDGNWDLKDLSSHGLGAWEPTYDTELWKKRQGLHLFVQKVEQVDEEGLSSIPPTMINVLEWKPLE